MLSVGFLLTQLDSTGISSAQALFKNQALLEKMPATDNKKQKPLKRRNKWRMINPFMNDNWLKQRPATYSYSPTDQVTKIIDRQAAF